MNVSYGTTFGACSADENTCSGSHKEASLLIMGPGPTVESPQPQTTSHFPDVSHLYSNTCIRHSAVNNRTWIMPTIHNDHTKFETINSKGLQNTTRLSIKVTLRSIKSLIKFRHPLGGLARGVHQGSNKHLDSKLRSDPTLSSTSLVFT